MNILGRIYSLIILFFLNFMVEGHELRAQSVHYRFNRIGLNQGLSNNRITAIAKDHQGFLWFGTASGLNRYDGYNFKVFLHKEGDTTTINDNAIEKIVAGPLNSMWVWTPKGWNKFDLNAEKFVSRPRSFLQKLGIPHEWFKTIVCDPHGNYWFVFQEALCRYNSKTGTTIVFSNKNGKYPLYSRNITSIAFDNDGNLWVVYAEGMLEKRNAENTRLINREKLFATTNGLLEYEMSIDKENDIWLYVPGQKYGAWWYQVKTNRLITVNTGAGQLRLNNNIVNGVAQDENGQIWIATDHGGVNLIDKKLSRVKYLYNLTDENDAGNESAVLSILKDDMGTIWLGTFKTGIAYFNERKSLFPHFHTEAGNKKSLPFNDLNCFAEDKRGNLWMGSNGGGLLYFNRVSETYRQYRNNISDKQSISNNVISSLFVDRENILWVGTYFGGLNRFNGKTFERYNLSKNDKLSLPDDSIWEIFEDSRGRLWIGTLRNGLQLFDRQEKKFISYRYPHAFPFSVNSIIEDKNGNIWAGGAAGIELYNKDGKLTKRFTHLEDNKNSLSNTTVLDIIEDNNGLIWIATRDGLNIYNPQSGHFTRYRMEDGLPHNTILKILKDHKNNFWLSTPNGICNISVNRNKKQISLLFRNFDETDGLQGRVFNDDAAMVTRKGELVFGGSNGFNIFVPPVLKKEKYVAPLILTDLHLFNNSVEVGKKYDGRIILPESIGTLGELVLNHDQNSFAIEFAALNFLDAGKIKYMYRLKGFNNTWINADGNNRKISFTGLNPGTYTLSIKARNENGVWMPGSKDIQIKILSPFWATGWAYSFYSLLIIGGLFYGRVRIIRNTRLKFKKEQESLEAKRRDELNAMKIHFFTNVSHEFKTPLALILSPIEELLKKQTSDKEHRQFQFIHRNARRLLNMVNELLDFRKLDMGELKLNRRVECIFNFCSNVYEDFSDIAERKNIHYTFHPGQKELLTSFDREKIERVLFNLLSNAFNFTPEGGSVSLCIKKVIYKGKDYIEIKVSDTGIGIPEDKLEKIFERFFQNDLPTSFINQGSGIGLSISKEFVRLHGGSIQAESKLNQGSDFIVRLPVQSMPGSSEIQIENDPSQNKLIEHANPVQLSPVRPSGQSIKQQSPAKTILLVEDNEDYRFYIKDNLRENFHVVEASNGKEGWQKALSEHPDLIVSDLNMPELSGIELCRKIKNDPRTSSIPFILLTVVNSEQTQLTGLDIGVNDYITKPFNVELLNSKIRNLLGQQDKFRETYQKKVSISTTQDISVSAEMKFIQQALSSVEENISNPDFSVQELSKELLLGRATLYRKIFEQTGQTPAEFIRSIRLQRAKHLLEIGQLTVSEIAYKVGFSDPKYFTKVFKETFDYTPSVYQQELKKNPISNLKA